MITLEDCKQAGEYNYKGLSTDTKPTNCYVNSLFLELDTGIFYFFNGTEWKDISKGVTLGESGPTGTISITENGIFDVHDYAEADVNVPAITPTGTISITENGTYDVTNYAEASVDVDVTVNFNLPALTRSIPTVLSQARERMGATSLGNYGLVGGGWDGSSYSSVVDAYDQTLTRTTPTALSNAREYLAATTVGNYALFGGGADVYVSSVVDAYDTSLTRTTPTALSKSRYKLAATSVAPAGGSSPQSGYALFGGGGSVQYTRLVVDAYDTNLTRTTPTELSLERRSLAATTVGDYALFGGGEKDGIASSVVDAYDTSLTRTTPTALSQARNNLTATTVAPAGGSSPQSGYALFGGGYDGSSPSNVVDAYDSDLTRSIPTGLSQARDNLTATTVGNYALFGGGYGGSSLSNVVDAYDSDLTRSTPTALSQARDNLTATTVAPAGGSSPQSGYALFGGGYDGSSLSNVVDAYNPFHDIQVFPETKYSFNGSEEQTSSTWQTISMQGEVMGYIKVKDANIT